MRQESYYDHHLSGVDFRAQPTLYRIGKGEQGVLMVEPYKSEILPLWRFRTPEIALTSSASIYAMFERYRADADFVGMDMARKYLQMGYTRARRYANHPSGRKFAKDTRPGLPRRELPRGDDPVKAEAARIFYDYYVRAREDPDYQRRKAEHQALYG